MPRLTHSLEHHLAEQLGRTDGESTRGRSPAAKGPQPGQPNREYAACEAAAFVHATGDNGLLQVLGDPVPERMDLLDWGGKTTKQQCYISVLVLTSTMEFK